ncbi:MAG: Lyzozyme M1 (1,4-beta-N-acetylmuramidase) [Ruminiclostridium sp.]|nr:Lyzozyme M1 (1,4-beta-N-acetylmuramidase) [Ruminiclostridium sp.]
MLKIKGIDISRAQEQFDFTAAVSAGVKFVIIRAGIRTDEDTYFRHNLSECQKRNIPYGLYWYFEATSDDAFKAELSACKKAVKGLKPSYPIFFDAEEQAQIDKLTTAQRTDMALKFCAEMTAIGLPSGVYANPSWMENYYDKSRLSDVDIWLAHWTESPNYPSGYDYGQKMWQWGIDSIAGKDVDGDICFVDYPAITDKWYRENCGENPKKPGKPENPDKPTNLFKKGDSVRVKRGARFTNGVEPYSYVYDTVYTVQQVSASGKETLIGIGSVSTGWLYTEDLYKAESNDTTQKFAVGDKVKVNYGAKTYNGGSLALFVYTNVYEVMQAGSGDRKDYIVIGQNGEITAAVKAEDLKKV